MKQIDIIQFSPYYPPHIWGVEKVVSDIHTHWRYGKSYVFCSDIGIGAEQLSENVITYPAFELVENFPIPKFWKKHFWQTLGRLKSYDSEDLRIVTHTRFFLSTFLWGLFAKKNNYRWIHIEHGSWYLQSGKFFVDLCAKIYDRTLWKWSIRNADLVLWISSASAQYMKQEISWWDSQIWYRGLDMPVKTQEKTGAIVFVYIGRLVKLKQVHDFISAYIKGKFTQRCVIIWSGAEYKNLKDLAKWSNIEFLGEKSHTEIVDFLQKNRCILVNPSSQEWLPTTAIEWLMTKNIVIATDVWGTSEITDQSDLMLYNPWDIWTLRENMIRGMREYERLAWKSYLEIHEKFSLEKSLENLYNFLK